MALLKITFVALLVLVMSSAVAGQTSSAEPSRPGTKLVSSPTFEAMSVETQTSVYSTAEKRSSEGVEILADAHSLNPTHIETTRAHSGSEVGKALLEAFPYKPSAREQTGVRLAESNGPVTMMEPFLVRGASERTAADAIEDKERSDEAELFDPTAGGRMVEGSLGCLKIELGIWKHDSRNPDSTHLGPNDLIHIIW